MSEYWKSTPKYWCKHCKTFVKDTRFEKTNHEATPKHQGNLRRFLRDLHKGHEREERDKQRAKDEVDRLNGVVPGSKDQAAGNSWDRKGAIPASNNAQQATPADRKKQLAQLAELGVAVPEDFRKEMAMVGDWQTTSETPIYDTVKKEESSEDVKPEGLIVGVRKRKFEGQEDEAEGGETVVRKGWGSTTRSYPGAAGDEKDELDALLNSTKMSRSLRQENQLQLPESQPSQVSMQNVQDTDSGIVPSLKQEESSHPGLSDAPAHESSVATNVAVKQEEEPPETAASGSLFKKRKTKPIRQK